MNDYIVLARKYRPESFETLIGQDNIATTLKNSIQRGQLAHAYLFCGPRGVGKTTTARIFAKMINCSNPLPGGEPCGKCESCLSFAEGRSYCIHEMDAASNNSVDNIKDLIDKVRIAPQVGKYSVYIIDEVHMLSSQAFNAFLKTLEEPPEYAIFILATTEKHKILPTILSRCQTYDFNRMSVSNIVGNLRNIAAKENISIDDKSLHVIALKADGAMRDALTIFDQTIAFCGTDIRYEDVIRNLNVLDYSYSFKLTDAFLNGDYATTLRIFDEVLSKGFNALHFVCALSSHFRDLLVAKAGGLDALLELDESLKADYARQAEKCSMKFLYDALGISVAAEQAYKTAVNPRLHVEFALIRLSMLTRQAGQTQQPAQVGQTVQAQGQAQGPAQGQAQGQAQVQAQGSVQAQGQAQAQAPAQENKPEAPSAAASQRRQPVGGIRTGASVSAIRQEGNKAAEGHSRELPDTVLDDNAIKAAWNTLCEISKSNNRLLTALTTAKLNIEHKDNMAIVHCALVNEALRQWLSDKSARIEAKLRELCDSRLLQLVLELAPEDPSAKVAVSDEEKAREMMAANPQVGEMIKGLGLEIK